MPCNTVCRRMHSLESFFRIDSFFVEFCAYHSFITSEMGQSLTRAADWTSAASGGRGKLALTPVNENILKEIVSFAEAIPSRHSDCSNLEFHKQLSYESTLDARSFGGTG